MAHVSPLEKPPCNTMADIIRARHFTKFNQRSSKEYLLHIWSYVVDLVRYGLVETNVDEKTKSQT